MNHPAAPGATEPRCRAAQADLGLKDSKCLATVVGDGDSNSRPLPCQRTTLNNLRTFPLQTRTSADEVCGKASGPRELALPSRSRFRNDSLPTPESALRGQRLLSRRRRCKPSASIFQLVFRLKAVHFRTSYRASPLNPQLVSKCGDWLIVVRFRDRRPRALFRWHHRDLGRFAFCHITPQLVPRPESR
jgi:hypothetical protein